MRTMTQLAADLRSQARTMIAQGRKAWAQVCVDSAIALDELTGKSSSIQVFAGLASADPVTLIRQVEKARDLVLTEDGRTFWVPHNGAIGAFAPWMLRAIADELDRRNARAAS